MGGIKKPGAFHENDASNLMPPCPVLRPAIPLRPGNQLDTREHQSLVALCPLDAGYVKNNPVFR